MINKKRLALVFIVCIGVLILTFLLCVSLGSTDANISSAVKSLVSGNFNNSDLRIFLYVR